MVSLHVSNTINVKKEKRRTRQSERDDDDGEEEEKNDCFLSSLSLSIGKAKGEERKE